MELHAAIKQDKILLFAGKQMREEIDHSTSKITQPQKGSTYGMLFTHLWIFNFTEIYKITDVWSTGKYKTECRGG